MADAETLAVFVESLSFDDVPDRVVERAKETVTDVIGVSIGSIDRGAGTRVRSYIPPIDSPEAVTVFDGRSSTPSGAALANGTLGEVLTYDDTFESMVIHPSSPIVPSVLAATELTDGDGRDLLTGYIAGVEIAYRIGKSTHPEHYAHGWHSTGTIGTFGAAAGAGAVLGLTAENLRYAFGIAASSSSTLRKNGGSMTFALHAGHAAQMGLRAARLALEGFTADPSVFEGDLGYGAVSTPEGFDSSELRPLEGDTWGIEDIGLKAYPCARIPHAAMDGLAEILERERLESEEVTEVIVYLDSSLQGILERDDPGNWIEARGSIEFCIGTILEETKVTIDHFTDEYVRSDSVREAMEKITVRYTDGFDPEYSKFGADLTVITESGTEYAVSVPHPPGSERNPLSDERRYDKFLDCTERHLGGKTRQLYETIQRLDEPGAFGDMLDLLDGEYR